jgi:tetratricopeptide (TPR) repeat protein
LFRLLGLFSAPDFPQWVAQVVLECDQAEALAHAEALVDAQLLVVSGTDSAGQYRYRFHDLVRLFAHERALAEEPADSRDRALAQGLGGWLALADRMAAKIPGPCYASIHGTAPRPETGHLFTGGTEDWADEWAANWFDAERTALLAGVGQACSLGLDELAFDLAGCMEKYFDLRGMYTDWVKVNSRVMAVCEERGNLIGEAVMLRGLIDVTTWITDGQDGDAMARLHAEAFRLWEMFNETGHVQGRSDAAVMCSWSLTADGAYPDAIAMATEALELAHGCGHLGGEIRADLALALGYFENRQVDQAIEHADSALAKSRQLGNPRCVATALQFCGIGYLGLGQLTRSRLMLDESLTISRYYRDTYTAVLTLLNLARLQAQTGDPDARRTAEESLALSREHNMSHHLAEALEIMGSIELAAGQPDKAAAYLEESVALWRTRGWHSFLATALDRLGDAYATLDPAAARAARTEAHTLFVRLGNTEKAAAIQAHLDPGPGDPA